MEEVIKLLKDLKSELEYLIDAPGDLEKREKRIAALDEAIMRLEDLYEIEADEKEIVDIIIEEDKNNE